MLDAVRAHPDLVLLTGLVLVAIFARGMLLTRAPLFLRRDSVAYFQVGWELANGLGFDLPLRRTPLYPLFIAGVVWTLGEDLRGLALAQHLLGLVTVASVEGVDVPHRLAREELLHDRIDVRGVVGEFREDTVLDVAEGCLGLNGDPGVQTLPVGAPFVVRNLRGLAQEGNLGQRIHASAVWDVRWDEWLSLLYLPARDASGARAKQ